MAEGETGERTEEASPRRLQEARERGQIPRSRELGNFATMIGGSAALAVLGGAGAGRLAEIMRNNFSIDPQSLANPDSMMTALGHDVISALLILLPIFGALIVLALAAAVALGGWNFSPQALIPDFSRMNPLQGLSRLFGLSGFSELAKALLKCAVVGGVCALVTSRLFADVIALGHMAPKTAIGRGAGLLATAFVWLCGSLAIIAMSMYRCRSSSSTARCA